MTFLPDNLLFDGNNMCHINMHANKGVDDDELIPIVFHNVLMQMKALHAQHRPKRVIIGFDESSWRKIYTEDLSACVTYKHYKGNRKKDKTPKELRRLDLLDAEMKVLRDALREYTGILTLSRKHLEADDLIAGYIQQHPDENHLIISSDKDYKQLLAENVKLFTPVQKTYRDIADYNNDPKLFLFEKCFRGDTGDWVMSSYPNLRKTKIFEAYTDDFKRNNLMNNEFVVETLNAAGELVEYNFKTKEVFAENIILMDLENQPDYIRDAMKETIDTEKAANKKLVLYKFLKFCGKYDLKRIAKDAESFIPLLN